jgi:hypothetical protein
MSKSWLRRKTSVSVAEAENMVEHPSLGPSPVAFGFSNAEWRELLNKMQETDELWEFSSGSDSWGNLAGRGGIALVRNGEIVDSIITIMN